MNRLILIFTLLFLIPAWGQPQVEANKQAEARYNKVKAEMEMIYKDIYSRLEEPQKSRFEASQKAWEAYMDAEAYAKTTPHVGGLQAIEVDYTTRSEVTLARSGILRHWLEQFSF